jgi:hypothetical protein
MYFQFAVLIMVVLLIIHVLCYYVTREEKNVEIIVTEASREGIGTSMLVVGIHDHCFNLQVRSNSPRFLVLYEIVIIFINICYVLISCCLVEDYIISLCSSLLL